MKLDELDTFQMYMAIKLHFTSDYDFFEYRGRVGGKTCSYEALMKKKYHHAIIKLSRTFEAKQLCDYFVSNMLVGDGQYLFDVDAEGKRVYEDFIRRKESRTYIFKQDVNRVCMELDKQKKSHFWDSSEVIEQQHPLLFRMFVGCYLAPETMCILYHIKDYLTHWDMMIEDTVLYPVVSKQIKKLSPFIRIKDLSPYKSHIEEVEQELFTLL